MSVKKLLLLKYLLTIRRRKKCLLFTAFIIIVIIVLIINFNHLLTHIKCSELKAKALNEICLSYKSREFTGNLCHLLCDTKTLDLIDCPNIDGHNGKDYVFVGHLYDSHRRNRLADKIVLKARTLTTFELIGSNGWKQYFKDNKRLIVNAINEVMAERFGHSVTAGMAANSSDLYFINQFLWEPMVTDVDQLNETTLINVWLLIQDNEFVLSKVYPTIFPAVVGTCGHFYGVKYADHILDISYFTPNYWPIVSRPLVERTEVGLKIIQFLRHFMEIQPKLELCDIKFEHLALMAQHILLIDSDMIYTKKAVIDSIEWISHCDDNNDCDFIDCKGVCLQNNKCAIDSGDDDLMRVCRNIFFMGKIYNMIGLGLFYHRSHDVFISDNFDAIYKHCFQRSNLMSDINKIENILIKLNNKLMDR